MILIGLIGYMISLQPDVIETREWMQWKEENEGGDGVHFTFLCIVV